MLSLDRISNRYERVIKMYRCIDIYPWTRIRTPWSGGEWRCLQRIWQTGRISTMICLTWMNVPAWLISDVVCKIMAEPFNGDFNGGFNGDFISLLGNVGMMQMPTNSLLQRLKTPPCTQGARLKTKAPVLARLRWQRESERETIDWRYSTRVKNAPSFYFTS